MRLAMLGGLLLLLATPALLGAQQAGPSASYVSALRTANAFLIAWSNKDDETGLSLVSRRLLSDTTAFSRQQYLEGLSNPRHWSFEIGAGTQQDSTRFTFPVVLYKYYWNEAGSYRYDSTIEVVRETEGLSKVEASLIQLGWRVDRVPRTGE